MIIEEQYRNDTLVLNVCGRLDNNTATSFQTRLLEYIGLHSEKGLVMNLEKLDYLSSAGLRVLVIAAKEMHGRSGNIVLCHLNSSVEKVLQSTGLLPIFKVSPTVPDATEAIKES